MDDDQISSVLHENEENNFTVVNKEIGGGEFGEDGKVSSTNGEEPPEDSYLKPYPPEVLTSSDKLIDFDDHIASSGGSNVTEHDAHTEPLVEPDWGPFNTNNSTEPGKMEHMSSSDIVKEFASDLEYKDKHEVTPASTVAPTTCQDKSVGDTACNSWLNNVDPRVLDLIYWRDVKKTGAVFGGMLFILLSLTCCTIVSVLSYLSLAVLAITLSFRAYKSVLQAVQKTSDQHPFRQYLDLELDYSRETVDNVVTKVEKHLNCTIKELRRLFLVEDLIDSLKFFLLLWVLTYIGAWFNGMTLIILAVVAMFSIPKLYETYQVQIDNYMQLIRTQVTNITTQLQEKVPFLKKKPKSQ